MRCQCIQQFGAQGHHLGLEVFFGFPAFKRDHEKPNDGQRAGRQHPGDIHAGREHGNRDDCPQADRSGFQQCRLGHGCFDGVGQFTRFLVAVVTLHDGLDAPADSIDQLTPVCLARTSALADQLVDVLRTTALQVTHDLVPFVQVFAHQPVDQALDLIFDLLRNVGQHALLELGPHHFPAYQLLDLGQAQGAVEEVQTALLQAVQDVLHFGQARRQFAVQFALVFSNDGFQRGRGHPVFFQRFGLDLEPHCRLLDQILSHPQRIVELELQAGAVVQRGVDERFQFVQTAARPQTGAFTRVRLGERTLGQFGGDRIQLRLIAEDCCGVFYDESADFLQSRLVLQDIQLVHHKDDLLAPGQDALQELSLAFGQRMIGGCDKQYQIAARNIFVGQPLVAADDGIRPGGVHDVQFFQQRQRIGIDGKAFVPHLLGRLLSPLDQGDA